MASSVALDAVILGYKKRINQFEISRNVLLNTLYQKYPELLSLRKDYAALRMDARKQKNNDTYKMQYAKVYTAYQALLQSCINKENIPAAHITYHPMCKICGDTGYVGDAEKKHCSCVIANAAQNIMVSSRINDQETLDNFDLSLFDDVTAILKNMTQRQLMKKMHDYLVTWKDAFPKSDKKQLLIIGDVGLGKSYCLNAVAHAIIQKGYTAMMVTASAINEAAFDEIKKSDSSALRMMRTVDLLLIDDLGSEKVLRNITCPTLFNVLNERIRYNLHTVVSTNLNIDKIEERYGSRVSSRLTDKQRTFIPPILGKDIRSKY